MFKDTGNQESLSADLLCFDQGGLDYLTVDPMFRRPNRGSVRDSPRERPTALDDGQSADLAVGRLVDDPAEIRRGRGREGKRCQAA
jgi:hypothetical protein